ncbi:MAG: Hsp20/alpha crystallin family protein, partial [Actinomycetota bacterium]|nr:Hsp20/alpha crystallin family protein [Actinomycetota bacterium]
MLLRFDPFRDLTPTWTRPNAPTLPVDAVRHGDEVVITADLPGVDPADVDVTVDRQVLTIAATRRASSPAEATRVLATERSRGRMTRRFTLGDTVDAGGITADLIQGVLTVR